MEKINSQTQICDLSLVVKDICHHFKAWPLVYTYNVNCGVKELSNPGPLYTEPNTYAEEEEMPEDEQRKSKLSRDIAEDNLVLAQPRS